MSQYKYRAEDGASVLRVDYPQLFAVIGTMYGTADATHFNLPDARGKFVRAWDHGATVDPDKATRTAPAATGATIAAGDHVGTEQEDDYKAHTHTAGPVAGAVSLAGASAGNNWRLDSTIPGVSSVSPATGGNETRSKNTYRMLIIRAL
jgi:microcystin-dependent protein